MASPRLSQVGKRPISERISIFEQRTTSTRTSSYSERTALNRSISSGKKSFDAIKSQFDVTAAPPSSARPPPIGCSKPQEDEVSNGHNVKYEEQSKPRHLNQNIDKSAMVAVAQQTKASPFRQPVRTPTPRKKSPCQNNNNNTTTNNNNNSSSSSSSSSSSTATKKTNHNPPTSKPSPSSSSSAMPSSGNHPKAQKPAGSNRNGSSKARNDNKQKGKSSTAPIKPSINVNTVTINLRKTTSTAEVNNCVVTSNNVTSRVTREKAMTAPIVTINVEPPSPKTSTVTPPPPPPSSSSSSSSSSYSSRRESLTAESGSSKDLVQSNNLIKEEEEEDNKLEEILTNNLKNQLNSGSSADTDTSEEARTYWTSQALKNDNSHKISQVMKKKKKAFLHSLAHLHHLILPLSCVSKNLHDFCVA